MQKSGSVLFLLVTAACLVLLFPQCVFADRSCSLTVHSYISQSGDESEGSYSEEQSVPDDASPLEGAVYSLWKIGDVVSQTQGSTVTLCACHMNDEFTELLIPGKLHPVGESDTGEPCYQLSDIQAAWDTAVMDETELTKLVGKCGITLPPSGTDGETRADNLPQGLYLLALTQVPDRDDLRVLSGHAPSLIILPQINAGSVSAEGDIIEPDDLWTYDVSVYPKSRTLESGKKMLLSDMSLSDADDRETGSTITYISYANLPDLGDGGNYDEAVLEDNMTDGLIHKKIKKVVCGAWLKEETILYDTLNTYKELSPSTDYTVYGGEHGFRLSLTVEGLDKINALKYNSGLYVIYDVLLGPNAAVGTDGPEINESSWTVSTDRTHESYTLRSAPAYAASYGIDLIKTGLSDASEARFRVSSGNSLLYFEKTGEGTYTVRGTLTCDESVSSLSPAQDGHLRIRGLDSASYTIIETKTEAGHSLLTSPLTVTLAGNPLAGSLTDAALSMESANPVPLSVSAVNGGIAEFSVSNGSMITPLKAGDNGYWIVAAFILVFGIMLLAALMIRKRRADAEGDLPLEDSLLKNAERANAAEDQNEKKEDQNTSDTD